MAFKMKGFSGFKSSPMKIGPETKKGGLSWSTALDQLKHGGEIDLWQDAKEKKAAKEQIVKDNTARATQDVSAGEMRMI